MVKQLTYLIMLLLLVTTPQLHAADPVGAPVVWNVSPGVDVRVSGSSSAFGSSEGEVGGSATRAFGQLSGWTSEIGVNAEANGFFTNNADTFATRTTPGSVSSFTAGTGDLAIDANISTEEGIGVMALGGGYILGTSTGEDSGTLTDVSGRITTKLTYGDEVTGAAGETISEWAIFGDDLTPDNGITRGLSEGNGAGWIRVDDLTGQ